MKVPALVRRRPVRCAVLVAMSTTLVTTAFAVPAHDNPSAAASATAGMAAVSLADGLDDLALDPTYERPGASRPDAAERNFPHSDLESVKRNGARTLVPGVKKEALSIRTADGLSHGTLLTVDLDKADVDILTSAKVAQTKPLDATASRADAVAALNGDFFQNSSEHEGVQVTGAAAGAEVKNGELRQTAVPWNQRYGGSMPKQFNDGNEVIGQLTSGEAVVTTADLRGTVSSTALGKVKIDSLNQYGLQTDEIAEYDHQWGAVSRRRATCGSEFARQDPCSDEVKEVIVTDGKVTAVNDRIGSTQLRKNQVALVGREAGARTLGKLKQGHIVKSTAKPVTAAGKMDWAIGGGVLVREGRLAKMGEYVAAPRSAVGISDDGRTMQLLAVDGRVRGSVGLRLRETGDLMRHLGSQDVVLLDGGGSTTMLGRGNTERPWTLFSHVRKEGLEKLRPVPNGIGVFTK